VFWAPLRAKKLDLDAIVVLHKRLDSRPYALDLTLGSLGLDLLAEELPLGFPAVLTVICEVVGSVGERAVDDQITGDGRQEVSSASFTRASLRRSRLGRPSCCGDGRADQKVLAQAGVDGRVASGSRSCGGSKCRCRPRRSRHCSVVPSSHTRALLCSQSLGIVTVDTSPALVSMVRRRSMWGARTSRWMRWIDWPNQSLTNAALGSVKSVRLTRLMNVCRIAA
jgi:hypothetical protein